MPETKFAGRSPFQPKPKRAAPVAVNIDNITVANDPLPGQRAISYQYKYHALFEKLKPGQCLVCEPGDVGKLSHAMSVWIKRKQLKDHVPRSTRRYEADGKGRVWLIKLGSEA